MLRLNFVTSCVNLLFSLSSVFGISGSLPTLTSSFLGFPGADLLPVTTHLPIAAANPLLIGNLKRIKELTCLPSCPPTLISTDTHPAKAPPGSFVLYSSRKLLTQHFSLQYPRSFSVPAYNPTLLLLQLLLHLHDYLSMPCSYPRPLCAE